MQILLMKPYIFFTSLFLELEFCEPLCTTHPDSLDSLLLPPIMVGLIRDLLPKIIRIEIKSNIPQIQTPQMISVESNIPQTQTPKSFALFIGFKEV